jgi:hypothetical protein
MIRALHFAWDLFYYLSVGSLLTTFLYWGAKLRKAEIHGSRHPWYTPSAWASSILFEVAKHAPNDAGMVVAGLYGVVEVCGLKRVVKIVYAQREVIVQAVLTRFRGKRVS